jgi:hypothetical protein
VTVAAAAAVDELSRERRNVEPDPAAQQRIESLERDRLDMRGVGGPLRGRSGATVPTIPMRSRYRSSRNPLDISAPVYTSFAKLVVSGGRCKTAARSCPPYHSAFRAERSKATKCAMSTMRVRREWRLSAILRFLPSRSL